jgi:hypothetical protein
MLHAVAMVVLVNMVAFQKAETPLKPYILI